MLPDSVIAAAGSLAGAFIGARVTLSYAQQARLAKEEALFEKRFSIYHSILKKMERYSDSAGEPVAVPDAERKEFAERLRSWYYEDGAGLLIEGETLVTWRAARQTLHKADATPKEVFDALSAFRTDLKVELGAREPEERTVPFAGSLARAWRRRRVS